MVVYPASMATAQSEPAQDPGQDPADETKRKFREALERKKANAASGAGHADGGAKKSHAHGPAEQRRTFRRKSGG